MGFSDCIRVNCDRREAFKALTTTISKWWGHQDNPILRIGDVFKVSWGEPWYQFEVTRFDHGSAVNWKCIDANQIIDGLESVEKEWVGTEIQWNIDPISEDQCEVSMMHVGLTHKLVCYEFCSSTWHRFLHIELKNYLESKHSS